jgi:hypothetical protein
LLGDTIVVNILGCCVAGQLILGKSNDNMEGVARERGRGWSEEQGKKWDALSYSFSN